ncbi:uncharacterized protein C2orf92 homolog isoform X3 [Cervus canadensis]|uniref:uncharacterized protein C2orf92 homolog isoform X3 n=1 Tax=Cervus canadensis TaxID=1574408 RepID=UPI001C9E6A9A|nr:uncharacterized protein C2orf92 homolog isoform X3 [Cervus canadensis]
MSTRGASNGSGVHRARRYPVLNSLTRLSHSYLPLYRTFPLDCEVKFGQVEAQHHTGKCRNRSNAEFSSNSKILDKGLAKLFGYPPRKSSRETDFALSSNKRDEHLAKLFDEILLQVFSKVPLEETRAAAGRSITRRDTKEKDVPTDDQNHNPPHVENISQTLQRLSDHIAGEQRDQESSLFNRDVSDTQLTTIDKGTHQEAVSPDVPSRGMPCSQLLQFLQKNIIVAAVSVVGIAVAAVLLLLALLVSVRKRQLLHSPADMTYNIFIMNGKTWWQKSQDKKTKKHAGKQKQLKLNSGI